MWGFIVSRIQSGHLWFKALFMWFVKVECTSLPFVPDRITTVPWNQLKFYLLTDNPPDPQHPEQPTQRVHNGPPNAGTAGHYWTIKFQQGWKCTLLTFDLSQRLAQCPAHRKCSVNVWHTSIYKSIWWVTDQEWPVSLYQVGRTPGGHSEPYIWRNQADSC